MWFSLPDGVQAAELTTFPWLKPTLLRALSNKLFPIHFGMEIHAISQLDITMFADSLTYSFLIHYFFLDSPSLLNVESF